MSNSNQPTKVFLLGAGGTGKTCFIQKISRNNFERRYFPSNKEVKETKVENCVYFDTSGQYIFETKQFSNFSPDVVLLFHPLSTKNWNPTTAGWHKVYQHYFSEKPLILVQSKKDNELYSDIPKEFISYPSVKISSKTGEGVEELVEKINNVVKDSLLTHNFSQYL